MPSRIDDERVVSTPAAIDALKDGGVRLAGTGQISPGDSLNVLLENPAGSGYNAIVVGLSSFVDASDNTLLTTHLNPTTDLPTTARTTVDANLATGGADVVTLYADDMTTEMSGGSDSLTFGVEGGRSEIPVYAMLGPGDSYGLTNTLGGLTSPDVTLSAWVVLEGTA